MIAKPFFDTQICELAAKGAIADRDWSLVQEYFEAEAEYHISPLTVTEILDRLSKDKSGKYFARTQEQIRRLYPRRRTKNFFDFIRYFVPRALFGVEITRPRDLESDFALNLEIVLWAESRDALDRGVVLPMQKSDLIRLRLEQFTEQMTEIRARYKRWLSALKGKKKFTFSPEEWLNVALQFDGLDSPENRKKFIEGLSAAYQFEHWIIDAARNSNYNLDKNISDQIDAQQLYYLCDPAVVFITNDSDHRIRLQGNLQSGRIRTFEEVLDLARKGKGLLES